MDSAIQKKKRQYMKKIELGKFEQSIEKLEIINAAMEAEGTNLQQSLANFKEGISLASEAQDFLSQVEQEVKLLTDREVAQTETVTSTDEPI
ncbi:MAG: exodeoxyribonuclease VII small subunit [Halioglobus sp.]